MASAPLTTHASETPVPVLGLDDVLLMIGHIAPASGRDRAGASSSADPTSELLDQMGFEPRLLEQICLLSSRSPAEVAAEVETLVAQGRCVRSGPWIERVR